MHITRNIRMQISRNIVSGPESNNYVLEGIWVNFCVQKPSHCFLQTFRPRHMFNIVFRDSSLLSETAIFIVCYG